MRACASLGFDDAGHQVWALMQGIRTVIAVNNQTLVDEQSEQGAAWNETWVFYPGRQILRYSKYPLQLRFRADKGTLLAADDAELRGNYPGDTRAALVPFLAHQVLGDYR